MNFRTILDLPNYDFKIDHNTFCGFIGSCFAENIGSKLLENKLPSLINPTGILYNPLSIAKSIDAALSDTKYNKNDIFYSNGLWNSYNFHSKFSSIDEQQCIKNINQATFNLKKSLTNAKVIFISFGTAYSYFLKENNQVVANCHKQIPDKFTRELLTVDKVSKTWEKVIIQLKKTNPSIKLVFTVSPIRHWKDGANLNQISKSTLHLSINNILNNHQNVYYFPSYEILMDELRDYRFYAEDMLHPSKSAIEYIWKRFGDAFFTQKTLDLNKKIRKINSASSHKVFNKNNPEYNKFCRKNLEIIDSIVKDYPNIDFSNEIKLFTE